MEIKRIPQCHYSTVLVRIGVKCTLIRWLALRYPRNRNAFWERFQCVEAQPPYTKDIQ